MKMEPGQAYQESIRNQEIYRLKQAKYCQIVEESIRAQEIWRSKQDR